MNNRLRTGLIILITLVWAANFITPLFRPTYKPPDAVNLAFMGVVGLLTAGYNRNGNSQEPPRQYRPVENPVPEPPFPEPPPAKKTASRKRSAR